MGREGGSGDRYERSCGQLKEDASDPERLKNQLQAMVGANSELS